MRQGRFGLPLLALAALVGQAQFLHLGPGLVPGHLGLLDARAQIVAVGGAVLALLAAFGQQVGHVLLLGGEAVHFGRQARAFGLHFRRRGTRRCPAGAPAGPISTCSAQSRRPVRTAGPRPSISSSRRSSRRRAVGRDLLLGGGRLSCSSRSISLDMLDQFFLAAEQAAVGAFAPAARARCRRW